MGLSVSEREREREIEDISHGGPSKRDLGGVNLGWTENGGERVVLGG